MNREEVLNTALQVKSNNICLELPTSFGKTFNALTIAKSRLKDKLVYNILIVVPTNVLKKEWDKEIDKWNMQELKPHIVYSTYVSLPKQNLNTFDLTIYDECHHLTDRCIEAINLHQSGRSNTINILLSATIKPLQKIKLNRVFYNLQTIKVQVKDAISEYILPDPEVLLIPLRLSKSRQTQTYIYGVKNKTVLNCNYANRWNSLKIYYKNPKTYKVQVACSDYEYYQLLNSDIEYATKKCREDRKRQLFNKRLKWLSDLKTPLVNTLLMILDSERTLTFCNSIDQCEKLGKYPIHSGKTELKENLEKFNSGKINHITACAQLDEGINAVNLRIGVYVHVMASDIKIKQRLGRILRHKKPVIIIPYYEGTREEEIVEKMKDNFNPEKIHIINYLNEIKNYLK